MNKLEIIIYNLVKDNPILKQKIVDAYQYVLGFFPQIPLLSEFPIVERNGYFFGFHDKSPFSQDGKGLLAHRNLIGNRVVKYGDTVEIGIFTGANWQEFTKLSSTTGWNWQLGAMLQWVGTSNECVAYNVINRDRHMGLIKNIGTMAENLTLYPIVHTSPDGIFACSYNFSRVEFAMPGYGVVLNNEVAKKDWDDSFKIFKIANSEITYEFTLDDANSISHHKSMDGAFHFFHHALFNPSSERVFFLHRWIDLNQRRWTRMFSVGKNGEDLYLFPMDEMVSHITWTSASELFAYMRMPNQGDGYYLVQDRTGDAKRYFSDVTNSDGHPTMDQNRGFVITDSYPDRFRNQFLFLLNKNNGRRLNLLRSHLPSIFKRELQVDLHPRLHPFLNVACVDSGHSGNRALLTLDFSSLNI